VEPDSTLTVIAVGVLVFPVVENERVLTALPLPTVRPNALVGFLADTDPVKIAVVV
jgi:hypothetical protein